MKEVHGDQSGVSQYNDSVAQEFHDRARASSQELHRMILSFATALLAIYFLSLTTSENSTDPGMQTIAAIAGMLSMSFTIFAGLLAYYCDIKRYFFLGCARKNNQTEVEYMDQYRYWHRFQKRCIWTMDGLFVIGVLAGAFYTISHILE